MVGEQCLPHYPQTLEDLQTVKTQHTRRTEAMQRTGSYGTDTWQTAQAYANQYTAKEYQAHIEVYNLELKTQEEKRDRLRGQLNTIKTNKEYAALQQEIAGHEADMSRLEDKILEMMTEVDDQEEAQRKAEEKLEAAKAELQKAERETADELKRCDTEETALNGKREKIRSQIADPRRTRDLHGGIGPIYDEFSRVHGLEPCQVLLCVHGVDDDEILVGSPTVHHDVIDDLSVGIEKIGVHGLAHFAEAQIVACYQI